MTEITKYKIGLFRELKGSSTPNAVFTKFLGFKVTTISTLFSC